MVPLPPVSRQGLTMLRIAGCFLRFWILRAEYPTIGGSPRSQPSSPGVGIASSKYESKTRTLLSRVGRRAAFGVGPHGWPIATGGEGATAAFFRPDAPTAPTLSRARTAELTPDDGWGRPAKPGQGFAKYWSEMLIMVTHAR